MEQVEGPDAVSFLQQLTTKDVKPLKEQLEAKKPSLLYTAMLVPQVNWFG